MTESPPPSSPPTPPPFPLVRSVGWLTAVTGVALLVVSAMLVGLDAGAQWAPAASTAGGCLVAALAALWPVHRASRVSVARVMMAALAAMGVRLALSAGSVALLIGLTPLPQRPTGLWALGWYLLLLVAEVWILRRYFERLPRPAADRSADRAMPDTAMPDTRATPPDAGQRPE